MPKNSRNTSKSVPSAKTGRVFIGHGRSLIWREVKDFVQDRLKLPWDEFNRESQAGRATKERLSELLDSACFALLVMTAEDEHGDGNLHARMNVVHEVGLFQGRLGFERAIILLEDNCAEFSNIQGLGQIRFPAGKVSACFEEIRLAMEREKIPGVGQRLVRNKSILLGEEDGLSDQEIDYLLTISRPRNQEGVLKLVFHQISTRKEELYFEMLMKFKEQGWIREGVYCFHLNSKGYEVADQYWRIAILQTLLGEGRNELEYTDLDLVARLSKLTDGMNELAELCRHLSALETAGYIEAVRIEGEIQAVRLTDSGRVEARRHPPIIVSE